MTGFADPSFLSNEKSEWLEADGLGGFASGTVPGIRTRGYHALLLVATVPPTRRCVLVNGFDAWVETPAGNFALSSQCYLPDVVHPDGLHRIEAFDPEPWPRWTFGLEDGARIEQEIFVRKEAPVVALCWRLAAPARPAGRDSITLKVRPFLSGRDYHALHHENPVFRFDAETRDGRVLWRPYPGIPGTVAFSNGEYTHSPDWYRSFLYKEERNRGLDHVEDLASPGIFRWDLRRGEAAWILAPEGEAAGAFAAGTRAETCLGDLREAERRRRSHFPSHLQLAADSYLVRRGKGKTIIAGYPWFTDWSRDTFISLRGLCLATGRLDEAREILLEWAGQVSEGMLPNHFIEEGTPNFNSVDGSLWYVIAVHDFLEAMKAHRRKVSTPDRKTLEQAVGSILTGYARGTRYRIHVDDDGLVAAGEPGVQLTWMDAKTGDHVVTPRIGKPVEIQALWLNALRIANGFSGQWKDHYARGQQSFLNRFWNEGGGYLYDVVDCDHHAGAVDALFRPNQIFAVGGLPFAVLEGQRARRLVEAVEARLWTPLGLRSLAPGEPGYAPHYHGDLPARDGAYHQGTVWPWLAGPFVEAWVRVRGGTPAARREARSRFLQPLLENVHQGGLGHLPEIADGNAPHEPHGCPFQAWSVGEALRLALVVVAEPHKNK